MMNRDQIDRLALAVAGLAEAHKQLGILFGESSEITWLTFHAWDATEKRLREEEREEVS